MRHTSTVPKPAGRVAARKRGRPRRGDRVDILAPVRHRETILELDENEQAAVMSDVARATAAIVGAFDPEGVAIWQNNGIPAHQSVPHVHFHVAGTLPEGGTEWGDVPALTVRQTDAIADELRPHLVQSV